MKHLVTFALRAVRKLRRHSSATPVVAAPFVALSMATASVALAALAIFAHTSCVSEPFAECNAGLVCPVGYRCSSRSDSCVKVQSEERCGDGFVDGDEECDCGTEGQTLHSPAECGGARNSDNSGYCAVDCTLNCGDNQLDVDELCDGVTVVEGLSCLGFGFDVGRLHCRDGCQGLDTSDCAQFGWNELFTLRSTTTPIRTVWSSAQDNIIAAGDNGLIVRYDGSLWSRMKSGVSIPVTALWGSSADDIFAVGVSGAILHHDGNAEKSWTAMQPPTDQNLYGIWGASSDAIVAVGAGGTIVHYDGVDGDWSSAVSPTSLDLHAVWGSAADDIFAVGQDGTILHYDGSWSAHASATTATLRAVWGSSKDDVFAVGDSGTILHYNGSTWTVMPAPTTQTLLAVVGYGAQRIVAVGLDSQLYHYGGMRWRRVDQLAEHGETYALWADQSGAILAAGVTDPQTSSQRGQVWSSHGYQFSDPIDVDFSGTILAMWGDSGSGNSGPNLLAVGDDGLILSHDETTDQWSRMTSPTAADLHGIWGIDCANVFAVGDNGTIIHYGGDDWVIMHSPTTVPLSAVWGSTANDVIAVGLGGVIVHYDGTAWSEVSSPTTQDLFAIWGSGPDHVFAVGAENTILHYNGKRWSSTSQPSLGITLSGIWGSGPDNIFIVAQEGLIWHHDGSSLAISDASLLGELRAIWGYNAQDVYVAGDVILHYDGRGWTPVSAEISGYAAVWGYSSSRVFFAGGTRSHAVIREFIEL